jgi:hypothetical protein
MVVLRINKPGQGAVVLSGANKVKNIISFNTKALTTLTCYKQNEKTVLLAGGEDGVGKVLSSISRALHLRSCD